MPVLQEKLAARVWKHLATARLASSLRQALQQKELERQKEVAKLEEMIDDLREDLDESERMLDESERMVADLTSRLSDRLTNLERGYVWEAVEEEREKHEGEKASWQAQARKFKAEIRQERQRRVASEHSIKKELEKQKLYYEAEMNKVQQKAKKEQKKREEKNEEVRQQKQLINQVSGELKAKSSSLSYISQENRQLQSKVAAVAATERKLAAVRQQVRLIAIISILDARRSYKTFNTKTY